MQQLSFLLTPAGQLSPPQQTTSSLTRTPLTTLHTIDYINTPLTTFLIGVDRSLTRHFPSHARSHAPSPVVSSCANIAYPPQNPSTPSADSAQHGCRPDVIVVGAMSAGRMVAIEKACGSCPSAPAALMLHANSPQRQQRKSKGAEEKGIALMFLQVDQDTCVRGIRRTEEGEEQRHEQWWGARETSMTGLGNLLFGSLGEEHASSLELALCSHGHTPPAAPEQRPRRPQSAAFRLLRFLIAKFPFRDSYLPPL